MYSRLLVLIFCLFISNLSSAHNHVWIIVDTKTSTLSVMKGMILEAVFKDIAIGRFGASKARMMGDNRTPLGSFKIDRIKEPSRYYRFFGLDFPNREAADLALAENRITKETWQSIIYAIEAGRTPPQNTPLGGHLGIHGLGRADQQVHGLYNWTNGCIALTNTQIDQLSKWLKPGVTVEIW
ncbi:L,D-transpeptidase catalytic domain [Nitrosomonas sp. Nm34]|jgi:murein L,D-transpeptidase YafK|nr:L,D-transpeptidase catalytic domain [Nitrosomonas sp. Nm34]